KGVSAPLRVFELRGIGPLRTRLDAAASRGLSRLIGREAELTWLDGIVSRSIASDGQVVGVVGDAGVGKSRLCLEFVQRCRARGIAVYEVHCPAHGATVPWLAIGDLLRSCFALGPGDGVEPVRRSIEEQLRALDAGLRNEAPLVFEVLGVGDPTEADRSSQSVSDRLAGFMRRFIRVRSAKEPVVLLLDDTHWIDR